MKRVNVIEIEYIWEVGVSYFYCSKRKVVLFLCVELIGNEEIVIVKNDMR